MSGALHQPRRRGGGRQVDPAPGAAGGTGRARHRLPRPPASRAEAKAPKRFARCCWAATRGAGRSAPKPCCSPPPAPTMSKRPFARRWSRGGGCSPTASSTRRSPTRAAPAGSGWKQVRALHDLGSQGFLPDRTLVLVLDEGSERARARDSAGSDRIGGRSADYHRKVDDGVSDHRRARARAGAAGRCFGDPRAR